MRNDLFRMLDRLSSRVRATERQLIPSASGSIGSILVDDATLGIDITSYVQTAAPTGLNQSTDVGAEWVNSGTGAVQWWDGFSWHAGAFPYENTGDIGVLGPAAVVAGNSVVGIYITATAPSSPLVGTIWILGSTVSQWQGSSWVTVTDPTLLAFINAMPHHALVRIFFQNTAPGSPFVSDTWYDTDDAWAKYTWNTSGWALITSTVVDDTMTALGFQTQYTGLRVILHDNDLDMYNGVDGESPGYVRASVVSAPRVTLSSGSSPSSAAEFKCILDSAAGTITLTPLPSAGAGTTIIDTGGGSLAKLTSSKRYKKNIRIAKFDIDKILSLKPHTFKFKKPVKGQEDQVHVGFIAEEAEELGLTDFVLYDEEGRPDAFSYPTYVVALQAVCQDLNKRLKKLEGK